MFDFEPFRIHHLPPYPLGSIAQAVTDARLRGIDVIDLSQMNPNFGAPGVAVDKLVQATLLPHNHRYSSSQGIIKLREAAGTLYQDHYGVELELEEEIVVTCGIKEGLSHLLLAVCSAGEMIVVPTPSYPVHTAGANIAGAGVLAVPLFDDWSDARAKQFHLTAESNGFFERLEHLLENTWPRPRFMVFNFPHNPTTTTVDRTFFERLVGLARERNLFLLHDFAYAEICFDGYRAPSILEIPGAKEVAVEFYSLSKSLNLPGWRVAFGVGNRRLISALKRIKSYLDFGVFQPLQIAAAETVKHTPSISEEIARHYQARRSLFVEGLRSQGWQVHAPLATPFLWAQLPEHFDSSLSFSHTVLEAAGVAVCPGEGFDPHATHFVRFAMGEPEHRLRTALLKMEGIR